RVPLASLHSFPTRRSSDLEAVFVKVTGLFRVSNVELNIVYSFDRQRVVLQFWIGWIVLRLNLLTYFSTSEIGGYEINSRLEKIIDRKSTRLNSSHVAISYA